jgi:hypothetical protein
METKVLSQRPGSSKPCFSGFQRQLNYFGFHRVFGDKQPGNQKVYKNPLFRRDHPAQLARIRRKDTSGKYRPRKRAPPPLEVAEAADAAEAEEVEEVKADPSMDHIFGMGDPVFSPADLHDGADRVTAVHPDSPCVEAVLRAAVAAAEDCTGLGRPTAQLGMPEPKKRKLELVDATEPSMDEGYLHRLHEQTAALQLLLDHPPPAEPSALLSWCSTRMVFDDGASAEMGLCNSGWSLII